MLSTEGDGALHGACLPCNNQARNDGVDIEVPVLFLTRAGLSCPVLIGTGGDNVSLGRDGKKETRPVNGKPGMLYEETRVRLEQRRGSNTRRQMLHSENSEQAGQEEQQRVAGKAVWCEEEDKRAAQCSERPDGCELQPLKLRSSRHLP